MITSKQRAYLNGLANEISTTLLVGKDGISANVIKQADDIITARELIKGKVLETSDINVKEVAQMISEQLHADIVQIIGRKFILYRKNDKKPKIELPKSK